MAGKYGSQSTWLLVDGYNLIAAKLQSLRHKIAAIQERSDGLGDSWEESTPAGMSKAELAQDGAFFDTTAGSIHAAMAGSVPGTPQATPRIVCLGYGGNTIGAMFVGFVGAFSHVYEVLAQNGKLTRANTESTVSGRAEQGAIVHAHGAETADGDTEASSVDNSTQPQQVVPITSSSVANPSVITTPVPHGLATGDTVVITGHTGSTPAVDGERTVTVIDPTTFTVPLNVTVGGTGGSFTRGETNGGGAGYLQMTSLTLGGHDGALVTLRHSVDDVTFVDLGAFTVRTTTGAQRIAIVGEIRRYTAQSLDFTGAGTNPTATYFAGVARA